MTTEPRPASPAWRLFIAARLPEEPRTTLEEQLIPYRRRHPEARWLAPRGWHLTLLFLGAVPSSRAVELEALVDSAAAETAPFAAAVEGGGGRVDRHGAGVAWLRVGPGARELIALADRLAAACPPGITLGAKPQRTLSAHLTVARRADRAVVDDLRAEMLGSLRAAWMLDRIALVRSHLGPGGSRYDTLSEVALYAADETPRSSAEEGDAPWR